MAVLGLLGVSSPFPAIDAAVALVNRGGQFGFAGDAAAGLGAARRRSLASANARRRADLADHVDAIEEQIERLEIYHLASPEGDLHFALLSDWTDSASETRRGDEALVDAAVEASRASIGATVQRRAARAFCCCIAGASGTKAKGGGSAGSASAASCTNSIDCCAARPTPLRRVGAGRPSRPADIRYVVTLDADTRLPRDTVRRLIGKMAHPLNSPRFDATAAGWWKATRFCSRA